VTLLITVVCHAGCGQLAQGRTGDKPAGRYKTRWSELDALGGKHAKTHPTSVTAVPEEATR
jgi:hypothetical protein